MPVSKFHPVTHVIFDMDGLLLDTETKCDEVLGIVCKRHGIEFTADLQQNLFGRAIGDIGKYLTKHYNLSISVDQFVEEVEELYFKTLEEKVDLMPGAERLVRHFKDHNIPICIATGSNNSEFKLKSAHHPKFFQQFSHIVMGPEDPEVISGKPDPQIFLTAARKFTPPPANMESCLVFEDSMNGVNAANNAGMQVIWVPPTRIDKSLANASLVLPSLEDFDPALFNLPCFNS